jgi:hypothetical protein
MGEFRYVGTERLIAKARGACREAVKESTRELAAAVRVETPKLTGDLAATTRAEGPRTAGDTVTGVVRQGQGLDYGVPVHQHWSGQLRSPARQVQIPLLRHRLRHLELLRLAGKKVF